VREDTINASIFFLSKGPPQPDSRGRTGLEAEISTEIETVEIPHGEAISIDVSLLNSGTATWLTESTSGLGIVTLGSQLSDEDGKIICADCPRSPLPEAIAPGGSAAVTCTPGVFPPGQYVLTIDLVSELVCWFQEIGTQPARVRVTILPD
jgi:hypothetical protein